MNRLNSRSGILWAVASFLAGILLLAATLFMLPGGTTISWFMQYVLIAAQEILLIGLPALLLSLRTPAHRERLADSLAKPELYPTALTSLAAFSLPLGSVLLLGIWYTLLQGLGVNISLDVATIVPEGFLQMMVAFAAAALIPAFSEELLFRGILLDWLLRKVGRRWVVVISSLLFASLHMSLIAMPGLVAIGIIAAQIRLRYNSLVLPMVLHAAYNAVVLLLNTLNAQPSPQAILISTGALIVVTYLLFRKEKEDGTEGHRL